MKKSVSITISVDLKRLFFNQIDFEALKKAVQQKNEKITGYGDLISLKYPKKREEVEVKLLTNLTVNHGSMPQPVFFVMIIPEKVFSQQIYLETFFTSGLCRLENARTFIANQTLVFRGDLNGTNELIGYVSHCEEPSYAW